MLPQLLYKLRNALTVQLFHLHSYMQLSHQCLLSNLYLPVNVGRCELVLDTEIWRWGSQPVPWLRPGEGPSAHQVSETVS